MTDVFRRFSSNVSVYTTMATGTPKIGQQLSRSSFEVVSTVHIKTAV